MKPQLRIANVEVDTSRFDRAVKIGLEQTTRSMAEFMRARMFFLLLRMFVLMPPRNVETQKNRIRGYLLHYIGGGSNFDKKTGKPKGSRRLHIRANLILQSRRRKKGLPGLKGKAMTAATGRFVADSINSAGYMKSGVVKALRKVSPGFRQYIHQRGSKQKGTLVVKAGNSALIATAREYGYEMVNVSMHKGTNAAYRPPEKSYKTSSYVNIVAGVQDSQVSKVDAMYNATAQRAFADEAAELERHLGLVVEDLAQQMGFEKR